MSWFSQPINEHFAPGEDSLWAFQWLHDPAQGVLKRIVRSLNVTLAPYRNSADDFVLEEVCGDLQCGNGASCNLSRDGSGGFLRSCDCSAIGDFHRLSVTLGCKLAEGGHFFDNKIAARRTLCVTRFLLTFRDVCRDPPESPCHTLRCNVGRTCAIANGAAVCECVTCDGEILPVCGSNGKTYRNLCELNRDNCVLGTTVTAASEGKCASQCDEAYCEYGSYCEEVSHGGVKCVCPSNCVQVHSPVCGSDHVTYENDCVMVVASCSQRREITVLKRGACDGTEIEEAEDSGEGSAQVLDECGCGYGATCDVTTIDDEDRNCNCEIECVSKKTRNAKDQHANLFFSNGTTVCGSNGVTYSDECELFKAQCEAQNTIRVVKRGKCPDHCSNSTFGCCEDGVTAAKGSGQAGCPETCQCHEHGSLSPFCDHATWQCVCRPGVAGRKCEGCLAGFWNFLALVEKKNVGCIGCQCEKNGSVRDDCDQITGQCACKAGVTGVKCSSCENGEVLTTAGCGTTSQTQTASSCSELDCQHGQECVELVGQAGRHVCQCPPLSSCNDFYGEKVCASNGVTYADECQMKVVACREAKVVTVVAQATCQDYFESLEPTIPQPTDSTAAVSTVNPNTTFTAAAGNSTGSGEQQGETDGNATRDDQDGNSDVDGSGDGNVTMPPIGLDVVTSAVRPTSPPDNATYAEDGEWDVPQFSGYSFLEFPRMEAKDAATIRITFKSADGDGLLLYNGQALGRDFISLSVVDGHVEFRFDTGSGHLSLRSTVRVSDGLWHHVVSRRNRREGMLKVDSEQEVIGSRSDTLTTGVNLDTHLFVGGFPDRMHDKVVKQTGVTKGLTGCINSTEVGQSGEVLLHLSSADVSGPLNAFRIADCATISPCLPNPCRRRSSRCFVTYQLEEFTHNCVCNPKFFGDRCQHRRTKNPCALKPCHENSTCMESPFSYRCNCPDSRTGVHCENLILEPHIPTTADSWYMPMFAGDSYIKRPPLAGVSTQLDIEIIFYTFQLEGLLFYNAHSENGTSDFVALNLRNGYLEFTYDLGVGAATIRSPSRVSLNKWHVAKLYRVLRIGDLKLDDGPVAKGKAPASHTQLDLQEPLYIGSVPNTVTLPSAARITTGLAGAIQKFVVNGIALPRSLVDDDSTSHRVRAFNRHACYQDPCLNGGACVPDLHNYSCECTPGFSGRTCGEVFKEQNDEEAMDLPDAVFFDGNVKAKYYTSISKRVSAFRSNRFSFQMKTTTQRGLIFYNGDSSKGGDFIALALNHGRLHLVFDLGSGQGNVVSQALVNDGRWKDVIITRKDHKASLQVDDNTPNNASAPPFAQWLNTNGILWLGGCKAKRMPSKQRSLSRSFYFGFSGCIRRFHVDGEIMRLQKDSLNHPELANCQNR